MPPWEPMSAGSAARMTAAVARRSTVTMRSHVSPGTSINAPGTSSPAAVTTPSMVPPARWIASPVAASAARVSARSQGTHSTPSRGGCRSMTRGRPPALATASTTAAPSPLEPPVTITASMSLPPGGGLRRGDGCRGRASVDVGHDDGLASPAAHEIGLGHLRATVGVVAAFDPDIGPQPGQHRLRRGLLEHHYRVHAVKRGQQAGPVGLPVDRTVGSLQLGDTGIGVQADDQAVTELPGRLEGGQVSNVEDVEAAAGGDHRAAPAPDAGDEPPDLLGPDARPPIRTDAVPLIRAVAVPLMPALTLIRAGRRGQ